MWSLPPQVSPTVTAIIASATPALGSRCAHVTILTPVPPILPPILPVFVAMRWPMIVVVKLPNSERNIDRVIGSCRVVSSGRAFTLLPPS